MTYGAPIDLTPPAVGLRGPRYAQELIDLARVLQRRVEKKVTQAGLDIRGTLSLTSHLAAAKALQFKNQAAVLNPATYRRTPYVFDQDLHYIDGGGTLIRVTRGGALDLSSVGGITGEGYGQGGATIHWQPGSGFYLNAYEMKAAEGEFYGDVEVDDLKLAFDSSNFIRLAVGAMSVDAAWRFPAARPTSTQGLYLEPDGDLAFSATPRHGEVPLMVAPVGGWGSNVTFPGSENNAVPNGTSYIWNIPVPLSAGARVKSVTVYLNRGSAVLVTCSLVRLTGSATTTIASWTNSSSGQQAVAHTLATPHTLLESQSLHVAINSPTGNDWIFGAKVVYDRP